jgi:multiple sugar transport system permease protein
VGGTVADVRQQFERCVVSGSTLLVLDLDVAEGDVDSAVEIARLLKGDDTIPSKRADGKTVELSLAGMHKVCVVRGKAAGVGALIALSCNSLLMADSAVLGEYEVLSGRTKLGKLTNPKDVQAALANEFLKSARLNGYSTALTAAMVTPDNKCWLIRNLSTRELRYVPAKDWRDRVVSPPGSPSAACNVNAEWEALRDVPGTDQRLTLDAKVAAEMGVALAAMDDVAADKLIRDVTEIHGAQASVTDARAAGIFAMLRPLDQRAPLQTAGEIKPPDVSRITDEGWFLLLASPPPMVKEAHHVAYTPTFDHYKNALARAPILGNFRNSLVVCMLSVLGVVLSSSLVAYGFSILRWKGRDTIFFVMLATMMLPGQVTMVPVFQIWRSLGLVDTFAPLVLPAFMGAPFFIFLFRQFFLTIPRDLVDAARMDGSSELGIYARVVMPLSTPAIATVALFSFLGSWNDFLGPLLYLHSRENYTLSIGLAMLRDQNQGMYGQLMGVAALMIIPVIILFFFAQKTFIQGIKTSGIKG